jgi:signal transduction histidine kinase
MEMTLVRRDVFPLVQQVVEEFEALAASNGITVRVAGESPAMAIVDAKLFAQIVRNLLSNALKFSPRMSEVRIELDAARMEEQGRTASSWQGMALELRVSDRGPGIPDAELESVFNKFVQSSHTRSGAGGTGLGLAICREIVSAHHGLIYARNRVGGGAEFVIRLPAGAGDGKAPRSGAASAS